MCCVVDGEAGIASALSFRPDLILLDIMLPGITGYAVAEQLTAEDETASTPIVFVTGLLDDEEAAQLSGMLRGRPLLTKPFSPSKVLALVDASLSQRL